MGTSGAKENVIAIDGKNDSKFLSNSNVQPLKNNVAGGMNPSPDVDKHGAHDAGLKERLAQLWGDDVGYIAKGEENANILQRLAYTWVRKYIRIAVKEELTLDGLPTAQADHRAYACGRKLSDVVLESYQRRHAWDHVVGARVSLSGDTASRGVVRWVGVPRSGRYKKVMVAVTWSVSPKVRNADDEADVSPFFSGTAHGEVLFPEETTNNSTMEEPENLIIHDTVGQLPLPKRISCARNLFAALPGTILWQFPLRIAGDVFTLTVPLLLKEYVKYLSALESTWTMGLILAFGIFLAHCLQSLVLHSFYHLSIKGGLCCRSALSTLIVEKCFIISSKALALPEMNTGRILNMLTTDVEHANEFVQFCMYLWSSPVIFCVSTFLLYSLVGWSALVTVVALPLTLLINGCIVRRSMAIQRKLAKVADARVKATNEFISGIRIVKFMAWEPRFLAAIEKERDLELSHLRRLQWCQTFIFFLNNAMPPLMIAAVFVTYHLTGNQLTPDVVFPTLMLLAIVRLPFILLPMALRSATQFAISMKRISMFLECENSVEALDDLVGYLERQDDVPPSWSDAAAVFDATEVTAHFPVKLPRIPSISDSFCSRVFGAICCCWCFGLCRPKRRAVSPLEVLQTEGNEEDDKQNSDTNNGNKKDGTARYQLRPKKLLRDINIQIPKGKLTVVLGATGSGKSTFLAALLGNFEVTHGRVLATKNIAYVPQQPWIMNATLRDNILFFSPLDEERLNMAIRVCQLEADLNQLPAGIETEIGEKGINLSGGQKARVSLARAVYANRDFYLLDDPLSALDAHVGGRIVKDLFLDHLVDKTRVLATHQVHVLPHADFVVALDEGTVQFAGDGEEFMRSPLYTRIAAEGTHHKTGAQEEDENKHPNCGTVPRDPNEPTEGDKTGGGEKETTEAADGRLTLMEEKAIGSVSWNVYKKYIAACGGSCTAVFVVLTYLFTELLVLASNIWLSMWSTDKFKFDVALNLYVYLGIVVVGTLSVPLRYILTFSVMRRGSRTLHTVLLRSVSLGKMSFFDTTPLGRIVNRFSRDIDRLDNSLPMTFMFLLQMTLAILSAVAVYIAAQPYVLAALVPVGYVYYRLTVFYSASNREIRRVGSTAKAPLMSLVGEAVAGSDTIAAYRCQSEIMKRVLGHIDLVYAASLLENSANRWIGLRVEFLNTVVILIIALVGVFGKMFGLDSHDIALVSLSLTMALTTTAALNWFVRMCGSMEADMNSVERILHYTDNIEHEDMPELDELVEASRMTAKGKDKATEPTSAKVDVERSTTGERDGRAGWVEFRDVDLRYRDGLPLVLNKVSFRINPGQKVGIVGRTGSGKSTLLLTFMRMVDICGGEIIVSGRPIHSYGLRELRQLFSMIPQDPVLFDGTIISNIDPFNLSTTEEVWHALEQVGMREHVEVGIAGLETRVQEGGTNYSVGQRQLLCLARALLRRDSDFILMDEATANIDHTLDQQIQNTVRTAFAKHTVITIAHRLHTVAQYDTIIVMDHGVVAEHGAPRDLVANPSSKFRELLNSLGGSEIGTFMRSMEADVSSMQN